VQKVCAPEKDGGIEKEKEEWGLGRKDEGEERERKICTRSESSSSARCTTVMLSVLISLPLIVVDWRCQQQTNDPFHLFPPSSFQTQLSPPSLAISTCFPRGNAAAAWRFLFDSSSPHRKDKILSFKIDVKIQERKTPVCRLVISINLAPE